MTATVTLGFARDAYHLRCRTRALRRDRKQLKRLAHRWERAYVRQSLRQGVEPIPTPPRATGWQIT